jgi:hypothetical protein
LENERSPLKWGPRGNDSLEGASLPGDMELPLGRNLTARSRNEDAQLIAELNRVIRFFLGDRILLTSFPTI